MPGLDPAGFRPGDHGVLHFVPDVFLEQDILFQAGSPFVLAAEHTLHLEGAPPRLSALTSLARLS